MTHPEISLYRELLDCLEQEGGALVQGREEAILQTAAAKQEILEQLRSLAQDPPCSEVPLWAREDLDDLRRRVAARQCHNRRMIQAALEVIGQFLGHLQGPDPGVYQAAGKVGVISNPSWFHCRV